MVSDPDTLLIETERIRSIFQQAPLTLLVTVINALLTALVLSPVINGRLLSIWTISIVAVSAGRWAIRQFFLRRPPEGAQIQRWVVLSVLSSLMTGILWGIGATVLCPSVGMYQLFLAFVVGGMCAGATTVNSAHFPTVLAFILPASLPLAGSFIAKDSMPPVVSALMIVIFVSALSLTSLRAHRAFGERIRFQLALRRQQSELSAANERLREEMAERRNAEATLQQAQKMEAIGHLTGGIAHDFNNLLQVVIGNMELIRRWSGGNTRILDYASAATFAAQRGARLTGSLLAFARRQTLRAERVNLNAELKEFQPILLRALGETIRFNSVFEPALPACDVDPTHFQSAILNLVINARDAMPDGGLLSITTGVAVLGKEDLLENPHARAGRFVTVSVQDSGCGMSDEILAKVFEPFFTTKEIGKGTGLGLSQVFGFAHQSGGHVRLRSKPGMGTRAILFLPAPDEVIEAPVVERTVGESDRSDLRGAAVLVVEDDPDVLKVLAACLSDAGCRVQSAQMGQEALAVLQRGDDVQCLLSDVALRGDLSGIRLARMARALRPDLAIILTTGHAAALPATQGVVEGEFRLLRKPFPPGELLARIGEAIGTGISADPG